MTVYSIALVLFLIMDPIGNVSPFLSQLEHHSPKKQRMVILREMIFALLAMLVFTLIGEHMFVLLHLSETTVRLSSGLILFLVALQILFPTVNSMRENLPSGEPFVIPLAIPLTAGPALLATVMLYSHLEENSVVMVCSIFLAWLFALIILMFGAQLRKLLGNNGLAASERLMGMILILLAIQRFMEGVLLFLTVPKKFAYCS